MNTILLTLTTLFFHSITGFQTVPGDKSRMSIFNPLIILVLLGVLVGCCGKVDTIVLLPDPDGKVGRLEVIGNNQEIIIDKAHFSTKLSSSQPAPSTPQKMRQEELNALLENALAAEPSLPTKFILYFQTGFALLDTTSTALLKEIHTTIQQKESKDISIIGHTDTLGDTEFNRKLSYERAVMVKNNLEAKGIPIENMEVTSHGEKNQLVKTPDNTSEKRNRRVEVTVR